MDIGAIIILFFGWNAIGGIILMDTWADSYSSWFGRTSWWGFVNPFVVYRENKKVNWFGAIVLALIFTVICPIGAVIYWMGMLIWLFCKLCTVGRR
jgi:hypothetical protein